MTSTSAAGKLVVAESKLTSALKQAATTPSGTDTYYGIKVSTLDVSEGAALESKGIVELSNGGSVLNFPRKLHSTLKITSREMS